MTFNVYICIRYILAKDHTFPFFQTPSLSRLDPDHVQLFIETKMNCVVSLEHLVSGM